MLKNLLELKLFTKKGVFNLRRKISEDCKQRTSSGNLFETAAAVKRKVCWIYFVLPRTFSSDSTVLPQRNKAKNVLQRLLGMWQFRKNIGKKSSQY